MRSFQIASALFLAASSVVSAQEFIHGMQSGPGGPIIPVIGGPVQPPPENQQPPPPPPENQQPPPPLPENSQVVPVQNPNEQIAESSQNNVATPVQTSQAEPAQGHNSATTPPPDIDEAAWKKKCGENGKGTGTAGPLTVTFVNSMDTELTMSFNDQNFKPGAVGLETPIVPLPQATQSAFVFNTGWSGRVEVGVGGVDFRGTKFEGAVDPKPFWDVSMVDGYSVPMVCSENSLDEPPLRGCNLDLWAQEGDDKKCSTVANDNGKLCVNNARYENAAGTVLPEGFFLACMASAYVYPKDDCATVGNTSNNIVCCMGTKCPPAITQHITKRDTSVNPDTLPVLKRGTVGPAARRKQMK